jgi:glutamate--cysteine ligase catalytic subunit
VLLGLIVNVINHFEVDFIIPISKADQNMQRAHFRDAILNQKFWVKLNCVNNLDSIHENSPEKSDFLGFQSEKGREEDRYAELSIYEILSGSSEHNYPGLVPLIYKFMEVEQFSTEHREQID